MKLELPPPVTLEFENRACVVFSVKGPEDKFRVPMAKLFVQAYDQYGHQRELSVSKPENDVLWSWKIYHHPDRRGDGTVGEDLGIKFVCRFLDICHNYPGILFNKEGEGIPSRPLNEGFVQMAEAMHRGWSLQHVMFWD